MPPITWPVPCVTAFLVSTPSSFRRWIDSSTTTLLSTSIPIPSARPPSESTLMLTSVNSIIRNVTATEMGMESAMVRVLRRFRRNRNNTSAASIAPTMAVDLTLAMESSMNRAWS